MASTRTSEKAKQAAVETIDDYIAGFPPDVQAVLQELRALIRSTAPGVTEKISYAMPTFHLAGQYLVYFAGWKKHIGLYPISAGVAAELEAELAPYARGKGSVQLPLGRPMPTELIRRMIEIRVREITGAKPKG